MNTERVPSHVNARVRTMPPAAPLGFRWSAHPAEVSLRQSHRPPHRHVPSQEELVASLPQVTRWERVSAALLLTVASVPAIVAAPAVSVRALASLVTNAARKDEP